MKKAMIASALILCCGTSYAGSVCANTDDVIVVLDPAINGSSNTYNETEKTWQVKFTYGTVTGIASCNNINGGSQGTINTTDAMSQADNSGSYCWCKMVSPAESACSFYNSYGHCSSYCASDCAYRARAHSALRGGLFRSAGI